MDEIKKVFANGMRMSGLVACLLYGYQFFVRKGIGDFKFLSIAVGLTAFVTFISFLLRKTDECDSAILYKISKWSTLILLIPLFMAISESDLQAQAFICVLFITIVYAVIRGVIEVFCYFKRNKDIDKRLDEIEAEFGMSDLSPEDRAEAQKKWVEHLSELEEEEKTRKEKAQIESAPIQKEPIQRQNEKAKKKVDDKVDKASKTHSTEDSKPGYLARKIAEVQEKQRLEAEAKEAEKCFCKLCGREYDNPRSLLHNYCPSNNYVDKRHVLFEGSRRDKYVCIYCGREYDSIRALVSNNCPRSPEGRNGRHVPFEGEPQAYYYCKHCGNKYKSIRYLVDSYCLKRPLDNKGLHQHCEPRR